MPWHTSDRVRRLPDNWASLRAQARKRAQGQCEAQTHHPLCPGTGNECDHIEPGDDHRLENLQWLSTPCHKAKTQTEGALRARRDAQLRRRPQEPHPGRRGTP